MFHNIFTYKSLDRAIIHQYHVYKDLCVNGA